MIDSAGISWIIMNSLELLWIIMNYPSLFMSISTPRKLTAGPQKEKEKHLPTTIFWVPAVSFRGCMLLLILSDSLCHTVDGRNPAPPANV